MTQCVKKIAGFIADVGNVFIKRLLILTFFYFCLNVYYIYIYAFKDPPPSMAVMSLTVHPSSPRFYDILGGITSPSVRTPWVVPWAAGLSLSKG